MDQNHRIYVVMDGGLVQDIVNIPANIEIHVLDYDVEDDSDPDRIEASPLDGKPCCISIFP